MVSGKCIVVAVSGAAHRGLDASLQEPLAVANGDVLRALSAVVNQSALVGLTGVERLLQGIQHKVCLHVAANPPDLLGPIDLTVGSPEAVNHRRGASSLLALSDRSLGSRSLAAWRR
jgi:hypothetical protein